MPQSKASLRNDGFTFKQFFVAHDRCAMKVGTDGVLLGAWAPVAGVQRVLDIGTGSGLLALMLAQRTQNTVSVDAIEIDEAAARQAQENARLSRWPDRVTVHCEDVRQWCLRQSVRYDLIVSNPPYYTKGMRCRTPSRETARHMLHLDHHSLLDCAQRLISETGMFCLVLPQIAGNALAARAVRQGWHCRRRTDVLDNRQRPAHRVLLGFSPAGGDLAHDQLILRDDNQHYSADYCSLTRDFYLFL